MPKQKRDRILYDRRELIKELKDTCKHRRQTLQDADAFEKITPHNPIALIMKKIKQLASDQLLKELNEIIKVEF